MRNPRIHIIKEKRCFALLYISLSCRFLFYFLLYDLMLGKTNGGLVFRKTTPDRSVDTSSCVGAEFKILFTVISVHCFNKTFLPVVNEILERNIIPAKFLRLINDETNIFLNHCVPCCHKNNITLVFFRNKNLS